MVLGLTIATRDWAGNRRSPERDAARGARAGPDALRQPAMTADSVIESSRQSGLRVHARSVCSHLAPRRTAS